MYLCEVIGVGWDARTSQLSMQVFRDNWVKFDALLVCIGVFDAWIARSLLHFQDEAGLSVLMVVRMLRLGRLARTLRLLVKFQVLWMLVRGLFSSAGVVGVSGRARVLCHREAAPEMHCVRRGRCRSAGRERERERCA